MFNLVMMSIVLLGSVNWFAIGVFQFDIIAGLFGSQAHFVSRFIYTLIGLAALYILIVSLVKKGNLILFPKSTKAASQKEMDAKGDKEKLSAKNGEMVDVHGKKMLCADIDKAHKGEYPQKAKTPHAEIPHTSGTNQHAYGGAQQTQTSTQPFGAGTENN